MLYAQIYLFQEVSPQKLTHANDGELYILEDILRLTRNVTEEVDI